MPLEKENVTDKIDYNALTHTEYATQVTAQLFHGNYQCFPQWQNLMYKDNCPEFTIEIKEVINRFVVEAEQALSDKTQESNALTFLGLVHYNGGVYGINDIAKATEFFEKANAMNHAFAMCLLSKIYDPELGSPGMESAIILCQKAISLGEPYAMSILASIYLENSFCTLEVQTLLTQAAQLKNVSALRKLGLFLKKDNVLEALLFFQEGAHLGDLMSMVECCNIFFYSDDKAHVDLILGLYYLEKIIQFGSQINASGCYPQIHRKLYREGFTVKPLLDFTSDRLINLMFDDLLLNRHPTKETLDLLKNSKNLCIQKILDHPFDLEFLKKLSHPNHVISKILDVCSKEYKILVNHIKQIQGSFKIVDNFFSEREGFCEGVRTTIIDYIGGDATGLSFFSSKKHRYQEEYADASCRCSIS